MTEFLKLLFPVVDHRGRWLEGGEICLHQNPDGDFSLATQEGEPTTYVLESGQADYMLKRLSMAPTVDYTLWIQLWDDYAKSIKARVR